MPSKSETKQNIAEFVTTLTYLVADSSRIELLIACRWSMTGCFTARPMSRGGKQGMVEKFGGSWMSIAKSKKLEDLR